MSLASLFFPLKCPYCRKIIKSNSIRGMCEQCEKKLQVLEEERTIIINDSCHLRCLSVFSLRGKVKKSLYDYKFAGCRNYAKLFAKEMAYKLKNEIDTNAFDYIAYVPLTKKAERKRGYNQSELLAKEVSKILKIPAKPILYKTKENEIQHTLNAKERTENVVGVFAVSENANIKNKKIILCDDIVTTTSTLRECAKVMLESGAKEIVCITLTTTNREEEENAK